MLVSNDTGNNRVRVFTRAEIEEWEKSPGAAEVRAAVQTVLDLGEEECRRLDAEEHQRAEEAYAALLGVREGARDNHE